MKHMGGCTQYCSKIDTLGVRSLQDMRSDGSVITLTCSKWHMKHHMVGYMNTGSLRGQSVTQWDIIF